MSKRKPKSQHQKRGRKFWSGPTPIEMDKLRKDLMEAAETQIKPQEVASYVGMAKRFGVNRSTVSDYLHREPASELALTIATGADIGIARVMSGVYDKATGKRDKKGKLIGVDVDIPSARLFLEVAGRIRNKVEVGGHDGGPVEITTSLSTNEVLKAALAMRDKKQGGKR
jgi:hypothetical protein